MQPSPNLQLSETQRLLRKSLRDLLAREVPFDRLRRLEREGRADDELWALLRAGGWLALPFPKDLGGEGGSFVDLAIVVEELARRAALVPYVETIGTLWAVGDAARPLVPLVLDGSATLAPALFGLADDAFDTACIVDAGGRLTGRKQAADYPAASHHLVSTANALFVIEASASGVQIEPAPNIGHIPKGGVTYSSVPARRIGEGEAIERLLRVGAALAAVQCLAAATTAFEMTTAYVANRVQFGRPIATFQAVQHECADMATMLEFTRFLVYEAVAAIDAGMASRDRVAVAKAWASRAAVDVTIMSHQLHGGIGVTEEYDLNFFSRRAKERALAWATEPECIRTLADSVDVEEAWV